MADQGKVKPFMLKEISCEQCGSAAAASRKIAVSNSDVNLCEECWEMVAWQCPRCERYLGFDEDRSESPIEDEVWCLQCGKADAAYCQWCKQNFWPGYLVWGHGGLACPWCLKRLELIENDSAAPLDEEDLPELVGIAIDMLPENLREHLECREVASDADAVTRKLEVVQVNGDDTEDVLVTITSCQRMPARLGQVFHPRGTPWPDDEMLEGDHCWFMTIFGRCGGINSFPADQVSDVDFLLGVLKMLATALCSVGTFAQDDCGRFIDQRGKLVFEWEHAL